MAFITTLYWHSLVDLLGQAQHSIHIVMPAIDDLLSGYLLTRKAESNVSIKVCIDNSEKVVRNGYGNNTGIDMLLKNHIIVRESEGNRVSFIIVDDSGYLLFPESRIFTDEPIGPNAVKLDPFTICRLIAHYFPPSNVLEKDQLERRLDKGFENQKEWLTEIDNEIIEQRAVGVTRDFDMEQFKKTEEALYNNPPIEPDLQRQIKTYTAKVCFVELKFTGINLQAKKVKIPDDAVPIENGDLKKLLLTNMKLFQDIENNEAFSVLGQIKAKVELLREDYLKPITCREGKSLMQVEMIQAFEGRLKKIQNEIEETNKDLPDMLEEAIFQSKDLIKKELKKHYAAYPPKELEQYTKDENKQRKLDEIIDGIMYRIPFPSIVKLIGDISLSFFYYDLTFQDFSDNNLIKELQKKKIMKDEDIKGIVDMKNAFAERK